jgi:hypothetical protein
VLSALCVLIMRRNGKVHVAAKPPMTPSVQTAKNKPLKVTDLE